MPIINYDFDFEKMVTQLLGNIHRKTVRIAWLTALSKPFRNLHDTFIEYFTDKKYRIKWNGQTIKLEQLLIDQFGEGIYITNNQLEFDGAFIGEGADTGFYIGEGVDAEMIDVTYTVTGFSFTVNVPSAIVFLQSEMEAWINDYKMYGTTYEIVII